MFWCVYVGACECIRNCVCVYICKCVCVCLCLHVCNIFGKEEKEEKRRVGARRKSISCHDVEMLRPASFIPAPPTRPPCSLIKPPAGCHLLSHFFFFFSFSLSLS